MALLKLLSSSFNAVRATDGAIIRTPSLVGSLAYLWLRILNRPFAVEVVGDPYEVFKRGTIAHALRPVIRWLLYFQQRSQCAHACGAAYVTARALQRRYPATNALAHRDPALLTHYSSVELATDSYAHPRRFGIEPLQRVSLISVGSLAQLYKGPDVAINAVAQCVSRGLDVRITLVGGGRHLVNLRDMADALGLGSRVHFAGEVRSGAAVRRMLDGADIFVLPSRTEGLPKALLEAMARGLPCIATNVGGIPELLSEAMMVAPDDSSALAAKIAQYCASPEMLTAMSRRNLHVATRYSAVVLGMRRRQFLQAFRQQVLGAV